MSETASGPQAEPLGQGSPERDVHLLLVEDDERIRRLLTKYLTDQGMRITGAPSVEAARGMLESLSFDLFILDIMLPGENGLEFTKSLRENDSTVPIILLTARGDPEDRIVGLEHGADDYLSKPFEPRELLLRINSILKRTLSTEVEAIQDIHMGRCRYNISRGELWKDDNLIRLTSGENALLKLFARNTGKTFSRLDLCQEMGVSQERSIDVQITRLRRKIEDDPRLPIYLQTVRGIGYVLIPD